MRNAKACKSLTASAGGLFRRLASARSAMIGRLAIYAALFMTILLINVAVALAQVQSHRISELRNIDSNLDLGPYTINASYINATVFKGAGTLLTGSAPSLSAGYATSAGNADTVDGWHGASFFDNTDSQQLGTSGSQITLTNSVSITAPYATTAGSISGQGALATLSAVSGGGGGTITDGTITNSDLASSISLGGGQSILYGSGTLRANDVVCSGCIGSSEISGIGACSNICTDATGMSGSGTSGYVAKFNGGTSLTDSLIRDTGSYVGISTSPESGYMLHVNGDMKVGVGASSNKKIVFGDQQYVYVGESPSDDYLALYGRLGVGIETNGQKRIDVDSSGKVGIGTSAGAHRVIIDGSGTSNYALRLIGSGTNGAGSKLNFGDGDYTRIEESSDDVLFLRGNSGITISSAVIKLWWPPSAGGGEVSLLWNSGTGEVRSGVSSLRYKKDVADLNVNTSSVLNLRPVEFKYKSSGNADIGLIAEEVDEEIPMLVTYNNQSQPESVRYHLLAVYLLKVIQDQQKTIDLQQQDLSQLKADVAEIKQQLLSR